MVFWFLEGINYAAVLTMFLYHYYDKKIGPFMNLSELQDRQAEKILEQIKKEKPNSQCARRDPEYMFRRRMYEDILRKEFLKKGGVIKRKAPRYTVLEHSPWPRDDDSKEYRRKIYTFDEILVLIDKYGFPQDWNDDGKYGPERYIEAHIWSDETVDKYRNVKDRTL